MRIIKYTDIDDEHTMNTSTRWMSILLTIAFTALYLATAAPDVQAGDAAEFQLAAVTAGVPHPTTYSLYVMLTHLMTYLPFGALAWRVTAFSALAGGISVGLCNHLLILLGKGPFIAAIGAIAFGVTPGLWNAATIAEVYTLLILIIIMMTIALHHMVNQPTTYHLVWVIFLTVIGGFYHGLFVITAAPMAVLVSIWVWHRRLNSVAWQYIPLAIFLGLTPLAYPFIQFMRFGPFNGLDYGLPVHYFWGAPQDWRTVVDLMTGGTVRRDLFMVPERDALWQMSIALIRRMGYEFGPVGLALSGLGALVMAVHERRRWVLSMLVVLPTVAYVLAIGPHIIDWPAFTIPLLVPLTIYIAWGIEWVVARIASYTHIPSWSASATTIAFLLATCAWGYLRYPVSAKQHLTLYRTFATTVHQSLPPDAVVITHWEQGMTLQYLRYAEGQRPDVWVDVVEPGDDPWLARAQRRYPGRAVYFVGHPDSVASMPVTLLIDDEYANLYQLTMP